MAAARDMFVQWAGIETLDYLDETLVLIAQKSPSGRQSGKALPYPSGLRSTRDGRGALRSPAAAAPSCSTASAASPSSASTPSASATEGDEALLLDQLTGNIVFSDDP